MPASPPGSQGPPALAAALVAGCALALLALPASLALPGAQAQGPDASGPPGPRWMFMEAFDAGGEYWFEVRGVPGRNPTIDLVPGEEVTVTLRAPARENHNVHFAGAIGRGMPLLPPGYADTFNFTVPADARGTTAYWCDPHRELGMVGAVRFVEAAALRAGATVPAAPLAALAGALAAAALLARGRARP